MTNGFDRTKLLIDLSETVFEADGYVEEFINANGGTLNVGNKKAFLLGTYGGEIKIVTRQTVEGQSPEEIERDDYFAMLHVIINKKWRCRIA